MEENIIHINLDDHRVSLATGGKKFRVNDDGGATLVNCDTSNMRSLLFRVFSPDEFLGHLAVPERCELSLFLKEQTVVFSSKTRSAEQIKLIINSLQKSFFDKGVQFKITTGNRPVAKVATIGLYLMPSFALLTTLIVVIFVKRESYDYDSIIHSASLMTFMMFCCYRAKRRFEPKNIDCGYIDEFSEKVQNTIDY